MKIEQTMIVGGYTVESIEEIAFKKNDKDLYDLYGMMLIKDVSTTELYQIDFSSLDFSSNSSINETKDVGMINGVSCGLGIETTTFTFNLKKNESATNILLGQKHKKPQFGIQPKKFWIGRRKIELKEAIQRYLDDNRTIPIEWLNEYNELNEKEGDFS